MRPCSNKNSLSSARGYLAKRQSNGRVGARLTVWKQNKSNSKNKCISNSLAAVIHKNKRNAAINRKKLCTPGLTLRCSDFTFECIEEFVVYLNRIKRGNQKWSATGELITMW